MKISGSEAIMQCLLEEGVDTVFGYPGGAIMPAYDALFHYSSRIRHILVRHEQGASHAAEGYARMTGKAGVCLVTSGPGATNLVTGIADAMIDSIPMVCITGQVAKSVLGTDAFQETDVMGITMPITKWSYQITEPSEIPKIFAKAFYIAQSGRPGPVLINITKNAQVETLDFKYEKVEKLESYIPQLAVDLTAIQQAADLLNTAKRPMLLVGHGVLIAKAEAEVKQLAEKSGIPVASTLLGLSAFPTDHERYVGMLGMHGNYGPNVLTNEADVILAVGMRFDDRVTGDVKSYANRAKVIHIEIDPAEVNKIINVAVAINSDAKDALKALIPLVKSATHPEWDARFAECTRNEFEKVIKDGIHPKSGQLKMSEVIRVMSDVTNGEAVVVADVGQHQMMAARYYRFKRSNSFITSGGLGTMGFAVPAAFGAKVAAPNREVIAVVGDGGFQMTMQELVTMVQEKTPVKIMILNNNFLGMVRQWQELFFENRYSFVNLVNPDFVKLAEACGLEAAKVSERENLEDAIKKMVTFDGPYLLEVVVEKEQNVFPMVPSGASISDIRLE